MKADITPDRIVFQDGDHTITLVRKTTKEKQIGSGEALVPTLNFPEIPFDQIRIVDCDSYNAMAFRFPLPNGDTRKVDAERFLQPLVTGYDIFYTTILSGLIGETLDNVSVKSTMGELLLTTTAETWLFYHEQECCEDVKLTDIPDNMNDLIGSPLIRAEERVTIPEEDVTHTFYEFATNKGSCTFRWVGESNGYYSERVDLKVEPRVLTITPSEPRQLEN